MLPDKIMQSDMLDILFENRNKIYGAYTLRKEYHTRLYTAVSITMGIAFLFIIATQLHHSSKTSVIPVSIYNPPDLITISLPPDKPEAPKRSAAMDHKPQAQANFTDIIIVPDDVKLIASIKDLSDKQTGDIDIPGDDPLDGNTGNIQSGNGNGPDIFPATAPAKTLSLPPIILEYSEIMPQYPGGNEAFQKFMHRNLMEPDDIQQGEKITVRVKFIVDREGIISGIQIMNSGREDLDKEVLRVINKMPKWIPGKQNGQSVAVYFNLPVTFIGQE